jgi:putative PIN family toxin of toxin-antitoxin system
MRIVLDTNILVSAFLRNLGKPAQILDQSSNFELILCEEILDELMDVLNRPRIKRKETYLEHRVFEYLDQLRTHSILVTPTEVENLIPQDSPDNLVLACAVEGDADYLVSGNLHLLNLKQHRGIQIVTPAQFLEIINRKS